MSRSARWALTGLLSVVAATPSGAQEVSRKTQGSVRERLTRIEADLERLNRDLKPGPAATADLQGRIAALELTIQQLERDVAAAESSTWKREDDAGERDARLDDLAEEIALVWEEIDAVRKTLTEQTEHPTAGYDRGFFLRSSDGRHGLRLNGFVRPCYRLTLQEPSLNEGGTSRLSAVAGNGFVLSSARIVTSVRLLEVLSGRLEIDYGTRPGDRQAPLRGTASTDSPAALRFLDAYGEYTPFEALFIRLGQQRVPFDRESRFDDDQLTFASRSLLTRRYLLFGDAPYLNEDALYYRDGYEWQRGAGLGRDLGLLLGGTVLAGRLSYAAGVFNGGGSNLPNDNRDLLAAVRLFSDPLGEMSEGMSDTAVARRVLLRVGAGFAFDLLRHERQEAPGSEYNSADYNATFDLHLKWRGVSALAAFFYRHSDHGVAVYDIVDTADGQTRRAKPIRSMGVAGQLAFFHAASKLEPAVRYALYDARLHLIDDHVHEVTGALAFHPYPDHLTLRGEYRGLYPGDSARSYLAPLGVRYAPSHEITLMAEVAF